MRGNVAVVAKPQTEEIHFHRGDVALCLLVNRRTRVLRVVDFRTGPSALKREVVRRVAEEEGLERAFTVVEREEAPAWLRMGFRKEGNIPGFYRRTDAHVLGTTFVTDASARRPPKRIGGPLLGEAAALDHVERTYQAARRLVRSQALAELPPVKVQEARGVDVTRHLSAAARAGRALTDLDPFGRGGEQRSYLATGRGGFSSLICVESQPCFGNALVEVVSAPRSEKEAWLVAAALSEVGTRLEEEGMGSVFGITLADSLELTAAMVRAGYRRTGRLSQHLLLQGERRDALLWSRRAGGD